MPQKSNKGEGANRRLLPAQLDLFRKSSVQTRRGFNGQDISKKKASGKRCPLKTLTKERTKPNETRITNGKNGIAR
jgi:hypothetical protein